MLMDIRQLRAPYPLQEHPCSACSDQCIEDHMHHGGVSCPEALNQPHLTCLLQAWTSGCSVKRHYWVRRQWRPHLWPEALTETTFFRRKSHFRSGYRKGTTKPPEAPSTWILMSQPFLEFTSPAQGLASCLHVCNGENKHALKSAETMDLVRNHMPSGYQK